TARVLDVCGGFDVWPAGTRLGGRRGTLGQGAEELLVLRGLVPANRAEQRGVVSRVAQGAIDQGIDPVVGPDDVGQALAIAPHVGDDALVEDGPVADVVEAEGPLELGSALVFRCGHEFFGEGYTKFGQLALV